MTLGRLTETFQGIDRRSALILGASALAGASALTACTTTGDQEVREQDTVKRAQENHLKKSPREDRGEAVTQAFDEVVARYPGADFSVACFDHQTGRVIDYHPETWAYEASLVKVPIALSTMRLAEKAGDALTQQQRDLITRSITFSDNAATRILFIQLGRQGMSLSDESDRSEEGAKDSGQAQDAAQQEVIQESADQLNRTYEMLGADRTRSDGTWGNNRTWALDQLQIIRGVVEGVDWVDPDDLEFLSRLMRPKDDSQQWGVGTMATEPVAGSEVMEVRVKNGWLPDVQGRWHVNSVGSVTLPERRCSLAVIAKGFADQQTGYAAVSEMVRAYFDAKLS